MMNEVASLKRVDIGYLYYGIAHQYLPSMASYMVGYIWNDANNDKRFRLILTYRKEIICVGDFDEGSCNEWSPVIRSLRKRWNNGIPARLPQSWGDF